MTSINASLNYLLAANFSELARPAYGTKLVSENTAARALNKAATDEPLREQINGSTALTTLAARTLRFNDLLRPKATLSPSDEAVLFDADTVASDGQSARRFFSSGGAQDENGDAVEVEIITPDGEQGAQNLAGRRQQIAANLYARNSDIIYSDEPAVAFAA